MIENWYETLGVEPTASEAEIKGAWRSLVTVLGPTDRRFAAINEAASVLLDAEKRSAYDATLTVEPEAEPEPAPAKKPKKTKVHTATSDKAKTEKTKTAKSTKKPSEPTVAAADDAELQSDDADAAPGAAPAEQVESAVVVHAALSPRTKVGGALARPAVTIATAVLAVALLVAAILVWSLRSGSTVTVSAPSASGPAPLPANSMFSGDKVMIKLTDPDLKPMTQKVSTLEGPDVQHAVVAATNALPKILCYDYRTIDKDLAAATPLMTAAYTAKYTKVRNELIKPNATKNHSISTCEPSLDAGVVRTAPGLVEVLVLIDVRTSFTGASILAQNFADMTMVWTDGAWKVDNITTAPIPKS